MRPVGTVVAMMLLGAAGCAQEAAHGRQWVHHVELVGARNVDRGEVKDGLATVSTGWWPFAAKRWFDPAALDIDLDRVRAYYADHGYFDARVRRQVRDRPDGSVDVIIVVEEGRPTRVTRVEVAGLEPLGEAKSSRITRKLPAEQGKIFDYEDLLSSRQQLELKLKSSGFAYAKVAARAFVDRDQRVAELKLTTDPGPLVRMGKIHVVGNGNIPDHAILNRVTFRSGQTYQPDRVGTTQGRLYDLGVFSSVRIELDSHPQEQPDVTIHVAPGKLHELRLGGGIGVESQHEEVRVRGEWTLRNFLGGLRTLRLRLKPAYVVIPNISNPVQSGIAAENDLTLKQPDIFGTLITLHAEVGYDLGIEEGYQYHGPRAQLGIERPFFSEHVLGGLSWNLQYLNFFNVNPRVFNPFSTPLGFGFRDPYRLAYLEQFVSLDLRDQPLDPRRGAYLVVRLEEGNSALGGDFAYLRVTPEARAFLPLGRRVTLAARGLLGWLNPKGQIESAITRRYNMGGPSSHRGFGFGRLAPQVVDPMTGRHIPIGGDGEVLLSGEVRLDLVKVKGYWLGAVPFFDAGDVTPRFEDLALNDLHLATGLQLNYQTPIGVARVGAGFRLNRLEGMGPGGLPNPDPGDHVNYFISIGEAF
jgi:translocation and assembly module TamA